LGLPFRLPVALALDEERAFLRMPAHNLRVSPAGYREKASPLA
jgi:hypothetical protein